MTNSVRVVATTVDRASGPLDRIERKWENLRKQGGKGIIAGAAAGATVKAFDLIGSAIARAGEVIDVSIDAASDLNETLGKSKIVFGPAARSVEAFGDTAARSLGISKQAAIEAAATFGNLFVGLEFGKQPAAEMSTRLVTLAGDLASFNNLDPTDVLEKLRSGLTGESEPLKTLGVFLTEAKVKAKAMELGLVGAHGELTEGAKVAARYALILEDTATAQGNFAATADDVANSARIADAELVDLQATLGEKLLPAQRQALRTEIDFFSGLNAVADLMNNKATPESVALGVALRVLTKDQLAAFLEAEAHRKALEHMADASKDDLVPGLKAAAAATEALEEAQRAAEAEAEGLRREITDLTSDLFDTTITTGELAEAKKDLDELLRNGPESKSAADVAIWNGKVAEAKQRHIELGVELAKQQGPQAFYDWLVKQEAALSDADYEARKYYQALQGVALLQAAMAGTVQPAKMDEYIRELQVAGSKPIPRQHGGPVAAGEPYIVGEHGPELFVPRTSGRVVPNGGPAERAAAALARSGSGGWGMSPAWSGAPAGGAVHLEVNFNSTWPPSASQAREVARLVAEELSFVRSPRSFLRS